MSISPALTAMLQRIFDDASTHLMKQYKQCSVEKTGCMYCLASPHSEILELMDKNYREVINDKTTC